MSTAKFELQDVERVRDYLLHSFSDPSATEEFSTYVRVALPRFLVTMEYLPQEPGRVLEIGSTPFFLTLLMKRFRPYQLELSNFFGTDVMDSSVVYEGFIDNPAYNEQHRLPYRQFNIERQVFPYETESLDGVVFCEVLEHLTADPLAAVAEMHRVLKSGGWLLVTTPNAAWYENIAQLWRCHNSNPPYSAHGPYGRHNREYTVPELHALLESIGFTVERLDARDLQPGRKIDRVSWMFKHLKPARFHEEGLFCLARKTRPLAFTRPPWLYSLGYKMPPPEYLRDSLPKTADPIK